MPIETEQYVPLAGSQRTAMPGARVVSPPNPNEPVEITVRIRPQTAMPSDAEVEALGATSVHTRDLAPSRDLLASRYSASDDDIAKVSAFAKAHGLTIVSSDPAQRSVVLDGPVSAMNEAFDVKLMCYSHPDGGEYRGRVGPVHVPKELEPIIEGVFGLDNRPQARRHIGFRPLPTGVTHAAAARPWFTPLELGTLYNFPPGDGAGQCVGILEFGGGFSTKDLDAYWQTLGISPAPHVVAVPVGTARNRPGPDPDSDGEVMLDIEVVAALVPAATVAVYFSHFTERGWVDALGAAVHDAKNKPHVISISWGWAEGEGMWTPAALAAVHQSLKEAALLGITVLVASGDDGAADDIADGHAHVDYPSADPFVIGVGGTTLKASSDRKTIKSETVWNRGPRETAGGAGGGGVSTVFPLPTFQNGVGVPKSVNPGHKAGRGVPDVAANADPETGYFVRTGGKNGVIGGTSAAAPLWAALIARINARAKQPVGYVTPQLYTVVAQSHAGARPLHDVTTGNNDTTGHIGGYPARAGWDACTGLGTPDGVRLRDALVGAGTAAPHDALATGPTVTTHSTR
jgi:kumamolisin